MVTGNRHFGRIRNLNRRIAAFLILLVLLVGIVAGSSYYSLVVESGTTVSSPPVELQDGTAGNSTIYANGTSAKVGVDTSGAGVTDVEDFVDNNISNVDNSTDRGTHSNFTAQKYGPDTFYDTLTEGNFTVEGQTALIQPFFWLDVNSRWDNEANAFDWDNSTSATENQARINNDIHWRPWNNSGSGPIFDVDLRIRIDLTGLVDDYLTIQWWVGSTQGTGTYEINSTNDGTDLSISFNDLSEPNDGSWSWADIGAIEIRQVGTKVGGNDAITYAVDEVWGWVNADSGSENYELDLEAQWTNVDYDEPYEVLAIYGGTMGAEDILVDVWYSSAWQNVFTDLSSGWNNVSIGSYLDSSNFTIRFKGGTETGDTTQTTWDIDASLLHVWAYEVLGNATTVTTNATSRSVSYGKDRAVLRTTDANNTLHVFQIDSNNNLQWWKSTDNGTTWSKQISSGFGAVDHFSVKKDSSNYIHIAYADGSGSVYYRKQLYNATSWGGSVTISSNGDSYQPDVAIAPFNSSWVYVVYDDHAGAPVHNEVWVRASTNGGTSFGGPVELTYNEFSYTGTFPSMVIDNTLGTYGHVYVTWYRGESYLYLRRGNITSTGAVNWDGDSNVQTISSGMSWSVTEDTNMMHSAMYVNGKYRVVYCESGTAKYRDWDESSWSTPISLATVSHYPSITYDRNNYTYVFYHTDDSNANYDIRYQRSVDTTPTSFLPAQNVTADNDGNRYVSAKLGGDNNRVEFAWAYNTSSPYSVKYNYIEEGAGGGPGQGDFNYVLKFVEKDNSNWTVRLKAYDQSNIGRLDNLTIYIYDGSNSTQIIILNGAYNQQTGPWYDLNASDTQYIWMHAETSSAGTSKIYTYLEIRVPDSTVYARYVITFEIT